MKCKYGNDNMVLCRDEYIWHCPHCGYEKFAKRSAYNDLVVIAKKYIEQGRTLESFKNTYYDNLREPAIRAWSKAYEELRRENI